ncbi:MAG: helix-turn-helix domain-containing protein, partial [Candidatus Moranbacteria bacterium]|nr:helix-turn-helix domain-containing protein [Candidatus Moranbacteria bacterium]
MEIFKKQLGQRIAEIRRKNNLTQRQLSKDSGLHSSYISSLEKGERNITFDNIIRIADALHIGLEELFTQPKKKKKKTKYKPKKIKFFRLGGTWDMKVTDQGLQGEGIMDDMALMEIEKNLNYDEENLMNYFNLKLERAKSKKLNLVDHLSWIRNIKNLAYGDFIPLFSGDSSHYRPSLYAPLFSYLLKELNSEPNVPILAGIGTDTTDIFVSMLDVFIFDKKAAPVLVSGANRSINEKNSDAPINFYELVITAQMYLKP